MLVIPIVVLAAVFILIAIRRIGRIRLEIWQIILAGALIVLLTGQISPSTAFYSINFEVIFFLLGMFIIGSALEKSNYLVFLSQKIFKKARSTEMLLLMVILATGLLSAFMDNDGLAILGSPFIIYIAMKSNIRIKPILLAFAFAITIGSVVTPIGNPQNLIIATEAPSYLHISSFVTFARYFLIPTIINLFIVYLVFRFIYRKEFNKDRKVSFKSEKVSDKRLALIVKISILVLIALVFADVVANLFFSSSGIAFVYIALLSALPVVLLSNRRIEILKNVDWSTLVFFISMFVLIESVWLSGFFQYIFSALSVDITSIPSIFTISIVLSQFISNVPLATLYVKLLNSISAPMASYMALAVASTIAGNLTILGAASNVIIIHKTEKMHKDSITFLDFVKIGIPITILTAIVYFAFIII